MSAKAIHKSTSEECEAKMQIVWINVIVMLLMHLGALYGFYLKFASSHVTAPCIIFSLAGAYGITAGAHRLWTHRSYKANTKAQILLMIMASLTYQNSVYVWARDHRVHHKYSETDADPHNAKRGFFFSHVGWLLVKKHPEVIKKGKTIDMSDLESNPIVMFQHRHYFKFIFVVTVLVPGLISHFVFGVPLKETFFVYTLYRYIVSVNTTWGINSFAHMFGFKPYDKSIGPTESPLMKIIGFGEGFHNYHHTFPWDYKAAEFSSDTRNSTTILIDLLAAIGWVTDRKTVSADLIDRKSANKGDVKNREHHMMKIGVKKTVSNIVYFVQVCTYIWII